MKTAARPFILVVIPDTGKASSMTVSNQTVNRANRVQALNWLLHNHP